MRQLLTTGTRGNPTVENLEVDGVANLSQVVENVTTLGSPISTSTTINVSSGSIYYYTTAATGNWTVDITDVVDLNTTLATGQAITVVTLVTQGPTAYYNTTITVDGSAPTITWLNGAAPSEGTADSVNVYSYTIMKTGNSAFTVLGSLSIYG